MSKSKKDQEAVAARMKCDAEGWCWTMQQAIQATMLSRRGMRVAELCDRKTGDLTQAVVYDFGMKDGWALVRCCPFCGGSPNARYEHAKRTEEDAK